jgi:hypothetical protein
MTDTEPRQALDLPPLIRTRYEERLVRCRQAWEASQDPQAAAQAIGWVFTFCQIPNTETWVEAAAIQALTQVRTKVQIKRYRAGLKDLARRTADAGSNRPPAVQPTQMAPAVRAEYEARLARDRQIGEAIPDPQPHQPLQLPPAIRAGYEKKLARCRRAWEATKDPLAAAEAVTWMRCYRQIPAEEAWIEAAAIQALIMVRGKAQAKRHREGAADIIRYICVQDLHDGGKGMSLNQAKQTAAEWLDIDEETLRKAYQRVKHERAAGRYWMLTDRRYRHLG